MVRALRITVVMLSLWMLGFIVYYFYETHVSEIIISDRMSEFIDTVDRHKAKNKKKLVIFDLDDTVFQSSELIGTPTWFYTMINMLKKRGAANYEAYSVVSAIDKAIQEKMSVVPVEQATLSAIRAWQKLNITVVGLTSRHRDVAVITKRQLDQIGLEFSSPYFSCVENAWQESEGAFMNGILFAGDNMTKGLVFSRFFEQIKECGVDVDLLAQADDQQRYVTEIARFAKKSRVDFVGIIYGAALSSRVFDMAQVKAQLLSLEANLGSPLIPTEYRHIFLDENG